jgi:hypothetical protein
MTMMFHYRNNIHQISLILLCALLLTHSCLSHTTQFTVNRHYTGYDHIKSRFEHYYLPHQHHLAATGHLEPPRNHYQAHQQLPPYIFLLSGALAGGIASFLTNPLDLAKLRIQVQRREKLFSFHYKNIVDGLIQIVRTEGWKGLWKGVSARLAFHVPASAVTVGTFDTIKQLIIRFKQQQDAR